MDDAYIIRAGGRCGFMNEAGRVIQPPVFEDMGPFHVGFATYQLNGKWGVIDATGVRHFAPLYDGIQLDEGMECGFPVKLGERWGYARLDGTLFIPAIHKSAQSFSEGLAAVEDDAKVVSYLDEHGVLRFTDRIGGPERFKSCRKRIEVKKGQEWLYDGLYGYLDTTGAVAIEPQYLLATSEFSHGRATVKTPNGYGIIDPDGKWVLEDCFMRISHPWHGHATVRIDEHTWAIVDVAGRKTWQCQAQELSTVFHGLVMRTEESGLKGLWDVHGKEVIQPLYQSIDWNAHGMAVVADDNWRFGIMDLRSGFIGECRFEDSPLMYGNLSHVALNDETMAYLDRRGRVVKTYPRQ